MNKWIELNHNPLTKINAHGHRKNHPMGYASTKFVFDRLSTTGPDSVCSAYPSKLHLDSVADKIGVPVSQLHDPKVQSQVKQYILEDYNKILDLCERSEIALIFVAQDSKTALYHQNVRSLDRFATKPRRAESEQDLINENQEVFFKESLERWNELNLTQIWDVRERMALTGRPFDTDADLKINLQHPHLWVNCQDLWTRTAVTIKRMMDYLELSIVPDRWQSWLPICDVWQQKQLSLLEFSFNQPHIVDAIINNWHYEIDLTFQQEVIIQHCLIHQHGLNLKTWQLEKFPNNTKDLHKLLEPNIHPL
jgi:hypothetical protein